MRTEKDDQPKEENSHLASGSSLRRATAKRGRDDADIDVENIENQAINAPEEKSDALLSFKLNKSNDFLAKRPQSIGPAEVWKVDNERAKHDISASALNELHGRNRRSASRNQVVDQKDFLAFANGVHMDFNFIDAIFEFIALADRFIGQLSFLSDRNEADRKLVGDCASKDKPPRFDAGDLVDLCARERLNQLINSAPESTRVG